MFTTSVNIQNYLPETISYQLEKSQDPAYYENLLYASAPEAENSRESLFIWVTDLCTELDLSIATGYLACQCLDKFLSRRPTTQRKIFELVGTVALIAVSKFKEGISISPEKIKNMLRGRFSVDAIVSTEKYMMQVIDWELWQVTACDLIESICEFTFGLNGTKRILDLSFSYAALCYTNLQLAHSGSYNIAVSSIYLALKKVANPSFRDEWLQTLGQDFVIDREKLGIVIETVERRMGEFQANLKVII